MSDLSAPPPPCGEALQETAPSGIGKAEDAPGAPAVGKEKLYFGPSLFICWQQSCQVVGLLLLLYLPALFFVAERITMNGALFRVLLLIVPLFVQDYLFMGLSIDRYYPCRIFKILFGLRIFLHPLFAAFLVTLDMPLTPHPSPSFFAAFTGTYIAGVLLLAFPCLRYKRKHPSRPGTPPQMQ